MKVADTSLTSGWEAEVARIEQGKLTQEEFLGGVLEQVKEVTGEIFLIYQAKTTRRILRHRHGTILKEQGVQAFNAVLLFHGRLDSFPLLTGKGLGLPRFCRKAAPFGGLVGQKKIILATLRYFLLPSLAQSPAKDSPASKKPKTGSTEPIMSNKLKK